MSEQNSFVEQDNIKNKLWFRARAIDADVVNENGDIFPKEEVISSYPTFVGSPITTNYDSGNPLGWITESEWNEEEKCVYIIGYIDADDHPLLERGIREGYVKDVAMSCIVDSCKCSICGNKYTKDSEKCQHILESKGSNSVHEENLGLNFLGISLVSDGAFEKCKIEEILEITDEQQE